LNLPPLFPVVILKFFPVFLEGQPDGFEGDFFQVDLVGFQDTDFRDLLIRAHEVGIDGLADKKGIRSKVRHLFVKIGIGERGEVPKIRNIDIQFFLDLPLQGDLERFAVLGEPPGKVIISPFRQHPPPGQDEAADRFDNPTDGRGTIVKINVAAISTLDRLLNENFNLPAATVWTKSEMGVLDQGISHPSSLVKTFRSAASRIMAGCPAPRDGQPPR